jgi:hypothetical protein
VIELTLLQLQEDEAFLQPVEVEIVSAKGRQRVTVQPKGKETTLRLKGQIPTKLIIDTDDSILKEVVN